MPNNACSMRVNDFRSGHGLADRGKGIRWVFGWDDWKDFGVTILVKRFPNILWGGGGKTIRPPLDEAILVQACTPEELRSKKECSG